jgi:protein-tyrosine phosphatase
MLLSRAAESRFRAATQRQREVLAAKASGGSGTEREQRGHFCMDMTWITGRLALGGGIWNAQNMAEVARAGITHIIDMQIEFDDTQLAEPHGIEVLWNPTDDDFQSKPAELFQRGVDFAAQALEVESNRVLIHCAAGVHRAAMMMLAVLGSQGWDMEDAMQMIVARRPVVDFANVYVESVERFLQQQVRAGE